MDQSDGRESQGERNGSRGPIGVLAIQGSFPLHLEALERLGVRGCKVTRPEHLEGLKGLILPGGESTVMSLLARQYGLFERLKALGKSAFPMFGTCAGAILLGHAEGRPPCLELAPVKVLRNAYGIQLDSFTATLHLSLFDRPFEGVFIRAPKLVPCDASATDLSGGLRVLGLHGGHPVLLQAGSLLLSTFHPELTADLRIHRYFLSLCEPETP